MSSFFVLILILMREELSGAQENVDRVGDCALSFTRTKRVWVRGRTKRRR